MVVLLLLFSFLTDFLSAACSRESISQLTKSTAFVQGMHAQSFTIAKAGVVSEFKWRVEMPSSIFKYRMGLFSMDGSLIKEADAVINASPGSTGDRSTSADLPTFRFSSWDNNLAAGEYVAHLTVENFGNVSSNSQAGQVSCTDTAGYTGGRSLSRYSRFWWRSSRYDYWFQATIGCATDTLGPTLSPLTLAPTSPSSTPTRAPTFSPTTQTPTASPTPPTPCSGESISQTKPGTAFIKGTHFQSFTIARAGVVSEFKWRVERVHKNFKYRMSLFSMDGSLIKEADAVINASPDHWKFIRQYDYWYELPTFKFSSWDYNLAAGEYVAHLTVEGFGRVGNRQAGQVSCTYNNPYTGGRELHSKFPSTWNRTSLYDYWFQATIGCSANTRGPTPSPLTLTPTSPSSTPTWTPTTFSPTTQQPTASPTSSTPTRAPTFSPTTQKPTASPTPAPTTAGIVPTTAGVAPTTAGSVPTTTGVVPTTVGVPTTAGVPPAVGVPTTSGVAPTTAGSVPTTAGVVPTTAGVAPTGIVPTTAGVAPTTAGIVSPTAGVVPTVAGVELVSGATSVACSVCIFAVSFSCLFFV